MLLNKENSEWKHINYRNVVSLLGAQFIFDLYDQYQPQINVFRYRNILSYYKDGRLFTYTQKKDAEYINENIKRRFLAIDDNLYDEIINYTKKDKKVLFSLFERIKEANLSCLTNFELSDLLVEWYYKSLNHVFPMNIAPVEYGITSALRSLICDKGYDKPEQILSQLLAFTDRTMAGEEDLALSNLALQVMADPSVKDKGLEEHYRQYHFLPYAYGSVEWKYEHFEKRLTVLLSKSKEEIERQINHTSCQIEQDIIHKEELLKELNDPLIAKLSTIGTMLGMLRDKHKALLSKAIMYRNIILKEIEKRVNTDITYLFLDEIVSALQNEGNRIPESEISKRKEGICLSSSLSYCVGEEARETGNFVRAQKVKAEYFKGICASTGKYRGKVKVCTNPAECSELQDGDVLVAYGTDFDYIDAMMRSGAIIVEEGGLLSHASVISRELKKPCIIGLTGIVSNFSNGDIVEINADEGIVKIVGSNARTSAISSFLSYESVTKDDKDRIGNKAYNVVEISRLNYSVPKGTIIPSTFLYEMLEAEGVLEKFIDYEKQLKISASRETADKIIDLITSLNIHIPDNDFFDFANKSYAVRSSGNSEDGVLHSFAGQHYSGLYVDSLSMLKEQIKKCWSAFYSSNVLRYRKMKNIGFDNMSGGILIQEMIPGTISGVMFTENPINKKSEIIIEVCEGSCRKIVDGIVNSTKYYIEKDNDSSNSYSIDGDRILTEKHLRELIDMSQKMELHFGKGIDIEWTYSNNKLYILQCRRITTN